MSKLIVTRGLPGSGKTTYAKNWVGEAPGERARVNRDDLRQLLHGGPHGFKPELEMNVTHVQEAAVKALLAAGKDVIVDDMNLRQPYARRWLTIATQAGVELEVVDLTNVSVETCVLRDLQRKSYPGPVNGYVGEKTIRGLHARYLAGKAYPLPYPENKTSAKVEQLRVPYVPDQTLPECILVDIDGTTAEMDGRGPHDYHLVSTDKPRPAVIRAIQAAHEAGIEVVFVSGRPLSCYLQTNRWLDHQVGSWAQKSALFMRTTGDNRKDFIVKYELFDEHIRNRYNVLWAYDDRQQVVDMYRSIGIDVFQVAPGDF